MKSLNGILEESTIEQSLRSLICDQVPGRDLGLSTPAGSCPLGFGGHSLLKFQSWLQAFDLLLTFRNLTQNREKPLLRKLVII